MTEKLLKVVVGGDWHHGISSPANIRKCMLEMAECQPNVVIMTGDASGHLVGSTGVEWEASRLRKVVSADVPILYVLGNHDWWSGNPAEPYCERPPARLIDFNRNLAKIERTFKKYNIFCLDFDGPMIINGVAFVGAGGWYAHPNPPTNDKNFLPREWDNSKMLSRATCTLHDSLLILDSMLSAPGIVEKVVFVSHFGVIDTGADWKGLFGVFNWSESIGQLMRDNYGCTTFICGHSHQRSEGMLGVWNAGSDYYKPKWLLLEV